jgi:ABC-2 type transport system ATP-binding protein
LPITVYDKDKPGSKCNRTDLNNKIIAQPKKLVTCFSRNKIKQRQEIGLKAVETYGMTKFYSRGKVQALEDVTLAVDQGKIFSLLGPNGAGKTTLIKILLTIVHPTRGEAKILGYPHTHYPIHSRIGYLAENHRFPEFLNSNQILYYYGKMAGLDKPVLKQRIPLLLKQVKLENWNKMRIRKFSKGMLQRLGLAHALLNDPDLLFLDEPTDGIDPVGRKEIRDILKSLRDRGKTIFLNSHLLSEVERISDEIAIVKNGQLIRQGRLDDFISIKEQYLLRLKNGRSTINEICHSMQIPITQSTADYTVSVKDEAQLNYLIDRLRQAETIIQSIIPRKISLEDYYIEVLDENGTTSR